MRQFLPGNFSLAQLFACVPPRPPKRPRTKLPSYSLPVAEVRNLAHPAAPGSATA